MEIRAPLLNGISQYEVIARYGATTIGRDVTSAKRPHPLQKKSPRGVSTAGSGSPSQ